MASLSEYPPVGFYFKVEFQGVPGVSDRDFRFQEVSGLNVEVEVEEVKEAGENRFIHKLPLRTKYTNLVLKRGMLTDSALIGYFNEALDSYFNPFNYSFSPCDIYISLLNSEGDPLSSWQVVGAYPLKWQISDFKSMDNSLVVETLEFAYRYFKRQ